MELLVRDKEFYRRFFVLTMTIALQNVIVLGVNLADNIMLGRYAEEALSGVALVNQIQYFLQMLIMGVGEGIVVMSSRYWGSREIEPIRRLTSIGLWLGIAIALVLWAVVFFFPHGCLALFSSDAAVIGEGVKYLQIICFSYLFFAITNVLIASLRSVETVTIGFVVSLSTLVINVCLNYVLIYGNFGAPRMGVRGAATATLTARVVETVIICIYVFFVDKKIRLRLRDFLKIDFTLFKSYLKIGSPVLLSNAIWGLAMAVQTAILGHMGSVAIAANSVATTVFQILSVIAYASASSSAVIIAKAIGEGMAHRVKQYAKTMQVLFLAIGLATGLLLFFGKDMIIQLYDISAEAKNLTLQFMTVLSITVVGTAYQMPALTGVVRGGGDTGFVFKNDMIFMWGIVLPTSAAAAFLLNLPPLVVFCCLKSDQILKCFVAIFKVNRFRWIKQWNSEDKEKATA